MLGEAGRELGCCSFAWSLQEVLTDLPWWVGREDAHPMVHSTGCGSAWAVSSTGLCEVVEG